MFGGREETSRVNFARPWTKQSTPASTDRVRPRRDVPRRFMWYFLNQASEPSTMIYRCCCYCAYSRMTRSHERRALGMLFFKVSRSDRQLAVVWLWRGAVTAFEHRGFVRCLTHRPSLVLLVYVVLLYQDVLRQLYFYLIID